MRLFYLARRATEPAYNCADAFVVAAPDESIARALCARNSGEEGDDCWTDPQRSLCRRLSGDDYDEAAIVIQEYNAS